MNFTFTFTLICLLVHSYFIWNSNVSEISPEAEKKTLHHKKCRHRVCKLRLRTWELPGSNLGPDTGCFDKCLWFFSVHRDKCRETNCIWNYLLTPTSFPFRCSLCNCHSTLRSLNHLGRSYVKNQVHTNLRRAPLESAEHHCYYFSMGRSSLVNRPRCEANL